MTNILQQQTIAAAREDWTATVPFSQFDPATGLLLGIAFTTSGSVVASASIENLAPVVASVSIGVSGTIVAAAPVLGIVGSIHPNAVTFVSLGAFQGNFDGTVDFASPSGTVLPGFSGTDADTRTFNGSGGPPFVGTGTFDVAVSSTATSTVAGNGNLAVLTHASAGATVSLDYNVAGPVNSGSESGGDIITDFTGAPFPIFFWQ